jgi:hypothetical protein
VHNLPAFVHKLRIVDLVHGVREMPGSHTLSAEHGHIWHFILRKGQGLNVLVYVSPEYLEQLMHKPLSEFHVLRAPLNEVTIVGFNNSKFTQDIESSTNAPWGSATRCDLHESLLLTLELPRQADALTFANDWRAARPLYRTGVALYDSCRDPGLHMPIIAPARPLECVGKFPAKMNVGQADLAIGDISETRRHLLLAMETYDLDQIDELASGVYLVVQLVFALQYTLIRTLAHDAQRLTIIDAGLKLIGDSRATFVPEDGDSLKQLFDVAGNIHEVLSEIISGPNDATEEEEIVASNTTEEEKLKALDVKIKECLSWLKGVLKPWRGQVQACRIPRALKDRGILGSMERCAKMSAEDEEAYIIVEAFTRVEGRGEMYLM